MIVVGLGALGSAATWVLARAGARVLGLEQFELGHHRGASHDHARIIRGTRLMRHLATGYGATHGFKFAPLLGRVLADLALHGGTDVEIAPFAVDRPALTAAEPEARYLI